jgi:N-acyl amino acid synthase of PEP-CTERM/exosortase system
MTLHKARRYSEINASATSPLNSREIGGSRIGDNTLLERFNSYFETLPANSLERICIAHRIRYQVYCVEHSHERSDNPAVLEADEFDSHAVQSLLIHRATKSALGTVRLILPLADELERSFAVQRVMDENSLRMFNQLPLNSTAEVSRFSISRQFCRAVDTSGSPESAPSISNSGPLMRLGLMQGVVHMSMKHGITHWCAAMEPMLLRMLSAMGIRFRPVGPLVEYHGPRQPCYCVIADVLNAVRCERPAFWSVLTDRGPLID